MQKQYTFYTCNANLYHLQNSEVRKKRLDELQKVLSSQEYAQNLIQEVIRRARNIPTENLRTSKAKTDSNNLAFVIQIITK